MKKIIILVVFIAFANFTGFSQNPIPNADFESWTDDNNPNSWYGLVVDVVITQLYTLSITTDAQSGLAAAKIETIDVPLLGALPGIASLSPIALDLLGGGIQFATAGAGLSVKPTKVLGYFKYEGVNGDTAMVAGIFTKWNTSTNKRDTLGIGGFMVSTITSTYTPFQFVVNLPQSPDSMNIMLISSAGYSPQAGSALYVDNMSMEYTSTAGIENTQLLSCNAFPNPATDEILFSLPEDGFCSVSVYDMTGKKVLNASESQRQFYLDVRSLPSGVYQVIIHQHENTYIHKVNVIR